MTPSLATEKCRWGPMLLSAAAASGVGCLVYLAVWGLLMRCRKRKALI